MYSFYTTDIVAAGCDALLWIFTAVITLVGFLIHTRG
jgi:hypothetical protein